MNNSVLLLLIHPVTLVNVLLLPTFNLQLPAEILHKRPFLSSLLKDFPDRDPEPEGPGAGAAPRPYQAPLHHQHGQNGRNPGQVSARRQSDHRPVLGRGNYESHVRRGAAP